MQASLFCERLAEYGWKPHRIVLAHTDKSRSSNFWHMREPQRRQRCTVSWNSRFQTVQIQQHSANLSSVAILQDGTVLLAGGIDAKISTRPPYTAVAHMSQHVGQARGVSQHSMSVRREVTDSSFCHKKRTYLELCTPLNASMHPSALLTVPPQPRRACQALVHIQPRLHDSQIIYA